MQDQFKGTFSKIYAYAAQSMDCRNLEQSLAALTLGRECRLAISGFDKI